MTDLAHDCALLGIPFDSAHLFYSGDPDYELWLNVLADKVTESKRAAQRAMKNET